MTLPIDKGYEIVFLYQHPMGLQFGEKALAKAVQYWLNRWRESKNPSDITPPTTGRPRETTDKVDQRIYKLAGSDNVATTGDIRSILKRQNIRISQETIR